MKMLTKWLAHLHQQIRFSAEKYSHLSVMFGWYCLITYPAFYLIWHVIVPQPFNPPIMRIIATVLALGLVLHRYFPMKLKKAYPYYWYFTLMYNAPFFFVFNLLENSGNIAWLLNTLTAVFIMLLLTDWIPMIVVSVIGTGAATLLYLVWDQSPHIPDNAMLLALTVLPIVIASVLFLDKKEKAYEQNIWQVRRYSEQLLQSRKIIEQEKERYAYLSRHDTGIEAVIAIAHEINQPISAMVNYISGCKNIYEKADQEIPEGILTALDKAKQQGIRAGEIIHTIKDMLVKSQVGKQACPVGETIIKAIALLPRSVQSHGIHINEQVSDDLPLINVNPTQLTQVLINLIDNACDAIIDSNSDQRTITIVAKSNEKNYVLISINNHGHLITKDRINKIFRPFISSKPKGLGLGLSLCYNIVQNHGGSIYVESKKNEGTTFNIILPTIHLK